jgi:hypothetical protein
MLFVWMASHIPTMTTESQADVPATTLLCPSLSGEFPYIT